MFKQAINLIMEKVEPMEQEAWKSMEYHKGQIANIERHFMTEINPLLTIIKALECYKVTDGKPWNAIDKQGHSVTELLRAHNITDEQRELAGTEEAINEELGDFRAFLASFEDFTKEKAPWTPPNAKCLTCQNALRCFASGWQSDPCDWR